MPALAVASELETHLQRPVDPVVAGQALLLASGAVTAYCGWGIARETTTLTAEGNGTPILTLPTMRLETVTAVRIGLDSLAIDDPIALSWSLRGQLFRAVGWPQFAQVAVDCTHGYDPVPDLIKLVVLEMAARTMFNPQNLEDAQTGQVSRSWGPKLSPLDERLLARYCI